MMKKAFTLSKLSVAAMVAVAVLMSAQEVCAREATVVVVEQNCGPDSVWMNGSCVDVRTITNCGPRAWVANGGELPAGCAGSDRPDAPLPLITTMDELLFMIEHYNNSGENVVIWLGANIDVDEPLVITRTLGGLIERPPQRSLTIRSAVAARFHLRRGFDLGGHLISVSSNATLILEHVEIHGAMEFPLDLPGEPHNDITGSNSAWAPPEVAALISVDNFGTLVMNDNAFLSNNYSLAVMGDILTYAGGVNVGENGYFIMNGGTISHCHADWGGGVAVRGHFTMNGGQIIHNWAANGGGVYLSNGATFTMADGEINNNVVSGNIATPGGGVFVAGGAAFTMTGGEINNNSASGNVGTLGGGVFLADGAAFTMTGGEINNNSVSTHIDASGGGVYVSSNGATFAMEGGEIRGNTASWGGGVYTLGDFTMSGGEITGNTARNRSGENGESNGLGGGVFAVGVGKFTITAGEISGNTASRGGGVYLQGTDHFPPDGWDVSGPGGPVLVESFGEIVMTGGEISHNTASTGGGVFVTSGGDFIMRGGEVVFNNVYQIGGAVFVEDGQLIMYSGEISRNYQIAPPPPSDVHAPIMPAEDAVAVWRGAFIKVEGEGTVFEGPYQFPAVITTYRPYIVVKWDRPEGSTSFNYELGSSTDLTVEPNAHGMTAVWSMLGDGTPGIYYSTGEIARFVPIDFLWNSSILAQDRVIIPGDGNDVAIVTPAVRLSGEFTAGPNPVSRTSGVVNFFRSGRPITGSALTIFDASGNVVNRVRINDNRTIAATSGFSDEEPRRIIGTWDLKDTRGRPVSEGTYLVRGTITTADGKKERVSVVVGVR